MMVSVALRSLSMALAGGMVALGGSFMSPAQAQLNWPPGFYRRVNEQRIRYISADGQMCQVMNGQQMQAFGGATQVRVVGTQSTYDRDRPNTGTCPWPDGLYREARWRGIWQHLFTSDNQRYYCNITTSQHLRSYIPLDAPADLFVHTIPNNSRLGLHREWSGDCAWPGGGDRQ